ncbi:MAG: 3,4-dihydroxy-2-butanone-4-phosphate synthase [Gammaproteobacteria bacterium]
MIESIDVIVGELSRGRMVVLVDDEGRENEGDLLLLSHYASAEAINFMATHGRGLICLTLNAEHCEQLQLPLMKAQNDSAFGTNFTVSIDAARGITTGISARDRAATVLAAARADATCGDIVSPGHIFPLRAEPGGVLVRAGHTEAGCDLAAMAGVFPSAVICEIMKSDGEMARLTDLTAFASEHNLKIGAVNGLIEHRLRTENLITPKKRSAVKTSFGTFQLHIFEDAVAGRLHLALSRGRIDAERAVLTRVIVRPTLLDGLLEEVPERSWSLHRALARINEEGAGIAVLLDAGGGENITRQVELLDSPHDNAMVSELRTYGIGAQILKNLGAGRIRLLSGKMRVPQMTGFGLQVEEIIEQ